MKRARWAVVFLVAGTFGLVAENPGADFRRPAGQRTINVDPTVDVVFPHVVNGGSWTTTFILVNLDINPINFELLFQDQNGEILALPIVGRAEPVTSVSGTVPLNGSVAIETENRGGDEVVGVAFLLATDPAGRVGFLSGTAVYRQKVPGRPDGEAAVPLSPFDTTELTLMFDNRNGFATGIALATLSPQGVASVPAILTAFNPAGQVILNATLTLPGTGHTSFALPERFPEIAGQSGTLHVQLGPGVTAGLFGLALRFDPGGAITSFPSLTLAPGL